MTRTILRTVLLAAALVIPAADSAAQISASDRVLFQQISTQVERYTQYTVFDSVAASIDNGHVILDGWVTMPYKRDDLERRVRRVHGVTSVENAIQVLPVSQFDDELRFRISRAIYGHSSFWQFASMPNPPIHIVVNRGRVSLEGVVPSNVERALARSLAGSFGALEVTSRLQTDAEFRETLGVGEP
ncbi:MAG: BON domain-containing protein [Acidobacteria bacterium]|nr:BON domain-containing protein [Acidobacteriota bacterium]